MGTLYKRETGYYWANYVDHLGKRCRVNTRCKDKGNAQAILAQLEATEAKRETGIIDATTEVLRKQSDRPIGEHVDDMERAMQTAGRSAVHVKKTKRYINGMVEFSKCEKLSQLDADCVSRYAVHLEKSKGLSARVVQAMITACKYFSKWCVQTGRLGSDPLAYIKKPSPKQDRRLKRRMILPKEWSWLKEATVNGPELGGMTGVERCLLYRTAIETGLRANELRNLTKGKLHRGYIVVPGSLTKNKKEAKQFISEGLEFDLRKLASRKTAATPLFSIRDLNRLSDVIRADLANAKRAYVAAARNADEKIERAEDSFLAVCNDEGEEITFHSLRHTCGAWLALDGQPVKLIQEVMRHSTVELTIGTYGHLLPMSFERAAAKLGDMLAG